MNFTAAKYGSIVAAASAGLLLGIQIAPCPACAAEHCDPHPAVPAAYAEAKPIQVARLYRPLANTSAICHALGATASDPICGCSLWGVDSDLHRVHIQIIANVAEWRKIVAHENAHGAGWSVDHREIP